MYDVWLQYAAICKKKLQVIQNDMLRLLVNKKRDSHTNMEKLRNELKMMSVNQLSCYHTAIEMFNLINNNSSASLHEEMIQVPKGYSLRGLEDGSVIVPGRGKKNCNGFHYMGPKLWNSLPANWSQKYISSSAIHDRETMYYLPLSALSFVLCCVHYLVYV